MQNGNEKKIKTNTKTKISIGGIISLLLAVAIFSGIFTNLHDWRSAFDFVTLSGKFGAVKDGMTFVGKGGTGVRDGFLLAISLVPSVMLAMGIVSVVEQTGGLNVAQRLLTPILRPIFGLPGNVSLALIASLQSTDAGAGMTKTLYDEGFISDKERAIFTQFQFSGCAIINNYLSIGSMVFSSLIVPIAVPLIVVLVLKVFSANMMRLIISRFYQEV